MPERTSKYDALGVMLAGYQGREVQLSLSEIAELIGGPLPSEAASNQFWANVVDHHDARRRQWLENGFQAYFDRSGRYVRFVRNVEGGSDDDRSGKSWSDEELRTCVAAYRRLWEAEQRGEKLNKSALRREALAGGMSGRVKGAYEFRMQNISALLNELGLPFVRGYLPRRNVGGLRTRLVSIINDVWQREATPESPTADPEALDTRVIAAFDKFKSAHHPPPMGNSDVKRLSANGSRFVRDPGVIAWVLLRADGRCEACGVVAPFFRPDGTPFLEVHHLRPLAEGGPDVVANAVAVCPNCHRHFHYGADRQKFRQSTLKQITALVDYPKRAVVSEDVMPTP